MFNPYDYDFADAIETITNLFETVEGRKFIVSPNGRSFRNMMNVANDGDLWQANGATKGVIGCDHWDFVIKLPFKDDIDYCAIEVANYNAAKQYDCSHMMAWTIRLDRIYGMPVYAQERVACHEEEVQSSVSEKAYDEWVDEGKPYNEYNDPDGEYDLDNDDDAKEYFYNYIYDSEWWENWDGIENLFDDTYTHDEMDALENWISRVGCCDMHSGNVGYRDGSIVLVDFSGYGMKWWLQDHDWCTMQNYY